MNLTTNTLLLVFTIITISTGSAQVLGSLKFDGEDNYAEVKDGPLYGIGNGDFTFEAWIRGNESDQSTHPMIFSNRGTIASAGGILFFFHGIWGPSESKMLCLQVDGNNHFLINNGTFDGSILDGECHHVAISRSGGTLTYYVDGTKVGTKTPSVLGTISNNSSLWIGKDKATNNTFNGDISQCRIWKVARTESEIAENKDRSLEGNEVGLLAYWEMNDGAGQVVRDKTNRHNGIMGESTENEDFDPTWSEDGCVEDEVVSTTAPQAPAFAIGPNPTTSRLTINNPTERSLQVQVVNQLGQLLFSNTINAGTGSIDLSSYPNGMYLLVIEYGDQRFTEKVIKQ